LDLETKVRRKKQYIDLLVNEIHVDPRKLCKNCGKLKGGHFLIRGRFYCYLDKNEFDVYEPDVEYWSEVNDS